MHVAHGQRFGKGIYTSPSIDYAARYGQGKVLVCAVLMGHTRQLDGLYTGHGCSPGSVVVVRWLLWLLWLLSCGGVVFRCSLLFLNDYHLQLRFARGTGRPGICRV